MFESLKKVRVLIEDYDSWSDTFTLTLPNNEKRHCDANELAMAAQDFRYPTKLLGQHFTINASLLR